MRTLVACWFGSLHELAEFLVKNGAPLNPRNAQLETPLHMCAKWPHEKVADVLCTAGADVNARNRKERTPAHLAALYMRKGVLERLITAGGYLPGQMLCFQ
jgi:ankyrin repeat protein